MNHIYSKHKRDKTLYIYMNKYMYKKMSDKLINMFVNDEKIIKKTLP